MQVSSAERGKPVARIAIAFEISAPSSRGEVDGRQLLELAATGGETGSRRYGGRCYCSVSSRGRNTGSGKRRTDGRALGVAPQIPCIALPGRLPISRTIERDNLRFALRVHHQDAVAGAVQVRMVCGAS